MKRGTPMAVFRDGFENSRRLVMGLGSDNTARMVSIGR